MSNGIPGTQTDLEHAIFMAERGAPGSAALVEEVAFWLDLRIGRATAASEKWMALVKQRNRLDEAAKKGGIALAPIREAASFGVTVGSGPDLAESGRPIRSPWGRELKETGPDSGRPRGTGWGRELKETGK